jgi:hypothetical protein
MAQHPHAPASLELIRPRDGRPPYARPVGETDDDHDDVSDEIVVSVRAICTTLPEVIEEPAWVGTRWRVRTKTFAHVLRISRGWPPVYARAAAVDGPVDVLMFRSSGTELDVLRAAGQPFLAPPWRRDEVGLLLAVGSAVDWSEVRELLTESFCCQAPAKLARLVERPAG